MAEAHDFAVFVICWMTIPIQIQSHAWQQLQSVEVGENLATIMISLRRSCPGTVLYSLNHEFGGGYVLNLSSVTNLIYDLNDFVCTYKSVHWERRGSQYTTQLGSTTQPQAPHSALMKNL